MRCRILMGLVAWVVGVVAAGCSSSGSSLFSPPTYPLLKTTKGIRDAAPVPAPVPRELAKVLHPPFVVEPGDTLLVQPAELDAPLRLPPDQPVFPDGSIDLGKYGRPVVAGHTAPEIEAIVQAAIKTKDKDAPGVNVRIIGRASKVYYVFGEVNAPGAFPLSGRETVLDALVAAGGVTRRASKDNIVMSRPTPPDGCRVVFPVCWHEIVQLGDTTTNYQIQAGDRVYVPSTGMLEGLLPFGQKKHACPACVRPQVSCFGGCGSGCAAGETPASGAPAPTAIPSLLTPAGMK
jgi:protein involved in polysaccharide export with SLBB domain